MQAKEKNWWSVAGKLEKKKKKDLQEILPLKPQVFISKGSIGHAFTVCIRTENRNQASFSPFGLHEISVLIELAVGHLRCCLTDVPPQPNSPPDSVFRSGQHPETP